MLSEHGFDLTQFDAMAANLDLVIDATQILDVPIAATSNKIPGPIQPLPFAIIEGMSDKSLRGEFAPIQITSRQTRPADIQLPRYPNRYKIAMGIQDVKFEVRDGHTDQTREART